MRKVGLGFRWITLAYIFVRGAGLLSAIILTRLLMPSDFGLMAISMSFIAFSQGITTTGFDSAIIQKQDKPEEYLDTAWSIELVRNVLLALVVFITAPILAIFFNEPRASLILRSLSLIYVLQGLRNIGVLYFRKNLDFFKQSIFEIIPTFINVIIVIPLAFYLKNVWALVFAAIISSVVSCILSYLLHPYRPRLNFEFEKTKTLFNFGKWIFGTTVLTMASEHGVNMFVGKYLSMQALGFYNRASVFSASVFQQVIGIVWSVGYPGYSQIHMEPEKFKKACLSTLVLLAFLGIPLSCVMFVLSEDMVKIVLTDKWLPIVPIMKVFCLLAILDFLNCPFRIAFVASGNPATGAKITLIQSIVLFAGIYPLSKLWGATGTAGALLISAAVVFPIVWYLGMKLVSIRKIELMKVLITPLISSLFMVMIVYLLKYVLCLHASLLNLFLEIVAGVIIYFISSFLLDRFLNTGIYPLMGKVFLLRLSQ